MTAFTRRAFLGTTAVGLVAGGFAGMSPFKAMAADKTLLRLSTPATATDQRSVGLEKVFGPAVSDFATYEPHYNATLFKQGTELEAIARGNLEMSITSPQELATLIPEWSIFTAGYLLRDADHQKKVFESDIMADMKKNVEDKLGVKLLTVMYLGRRQLDLRMSKADKTVIDAGRPEGREAPHAGHRRVAIPRQGARRQSRADGVHRGLHRAPDRRD